MKLAPSYLNRQNSEFKCAHCLKIVPVDPRYSGVQHRNHCPYCLWSRHLDLYRPGDRLSACKALMRPLGLTLKQIWKKYPGQGEIMLIHQCTGCGKLSINRIAADDIPQNLADVYEESQPLVAALRQALNEQGIKALESTHAELVSLRLFGKN